jgi:hypothetical protein
MSFFGKLLGSDKALDVVDKGLNGGMRILDAAFYTDQEKAENKAQMTKVWIELQQLIGKESSPTSISRRIIAWAVIGTSILTFCCGLILIGFDANDRLNILIEWTQAMKMDWAFVGVIGFYFGAHLMGRKK